MIRSLRNRLSKVSPLVGVLTAFVLGVGLLCAARYYAAEEIKAHVRFDDLYQDARSARKKADYNRIVTADFEGPVPRTAARMREASALAFVLGIARINEAVNHRPAPPDVDALLALVKQQDLLPPGLEVPEGATRKPGVVMALHATVYVRYRVAPFGIEVVSIGHTKADGLPILIRLPNDDSVSQPKAGQDEPGVALFTSIITENVKIPAPFSSMSDILGAGWSPETFRSPAMSPQQIAELNGWLRQVR